MVSLTSYLYQSRERDYTLFMQPVIQVNRMYNMSVYPLIDNSTTDVSVCLNRNERC